MKKPTLAELQRVVDDKNATIRFQNMIILWLGISIALLIIILGTQQGPWH